MNQTLESKNHTVMDHTVAVYQTHEQATSAIKALHEDGYNVKNLSIIGQDYASEEHAVGFVNTGDRMWSWGKLGAFWGYMWGLLFGSAMLFVPGLGFLVFAGWIVGALENAALVGGIAALVGALASIGTPKDSIVKYESALRAGNFLVLAHGSESEVARAKELLGFTSAADLTSFTGRPFPLASLK
jgi:hypothetical protein